MSHNDTCQFLNDINVDFRQIMNENLMEVPFLFLVISKVRTIYNTN
jgi:hypothetical protein